MTPEQLTELRIQVTEQDFDVIGAYVPLAFRTMSQELSVEERAENIAYGLVGESGELADLYKKHLYHKHELDRNKVIKECGDIMWYLANAIYHMNTHRAVSVKGEVSASAYEDRPVSAFWRSIRRIYINTNHPDSTKNADVDFDYKHPILELSSLSVRLGHILMTPYVKTLYFSRTRNSTMVATMVYIVKGVLESVGSNLEECLNLNVEKLKKRYPEGFSTQESIERKDLQQ